MFRDRTAAMRLERLRYSMPYSWPGIDVHIYTVVAYESGCGERSRQTPRMGHQYSTSEPVLSEYCGCNVWLGRYESMK